MTPKMLFGSGIALAVAGLALSLSPLPAARVAGAVCTLFAILSAAWISVMTRHIPVDSIVASKNRWQMGVAWTFTGIACVLTLLVEFRWSTFSHQAVAIMLFMLSIVLLLQPQSQGKISRFDSRK